MDLVHLFIFRLFLLELVCSEDFFATGIEPGSSGLNDASYQYTNSLLKLWRAVALFDCREPLIWMHILSHLKNLYRKQLTKLENNHKKQANRDCFPIRNSPSCSHDSRAVARQSIWATTSPNSSRWPNLMWRSGQASSWPIQENSECRLFGKTRELSSR